MSEITHSLEIRINSLEIKLDKLMTSIQGKNVAASSDLGRSMNAHDRPIDNTQPVNLGPVSRTQSHPTKPNSTFINNLNISNRPEFSTASIDLERIKKSRNASLNSNLNLQVATMHQARYLQRDPYNQRNVAGRVSLIVAIERLKAAYACGLSMAMRPGSSKKDAGELSTPWGSGEMSPQKNKNLKKDAGELSTPWGSGEMRPQKDKNLKKDAGGVSALGGFVLSLPAAGYASVSASPEPCNPGRGAAGARVFLVAGVSGEVRAALAGAIAALGQGGRLAVDALDRPPPPHVTHAVLPGQPRSAKGLGALVAGLWLVTPAYVFESAACGYWRDEEACGGIRCLPPPLQGRQVLLAIEPDAVRNKLAQVIEHGGGNIVKNKSPSTIVFHSGDELLTYIYKACGFITSE